MTNKNLLRSHMALKGLTDGDLAKEIGVSRQSVSYKINNKREFRVPEIDTIAKMLDLTANDVMMIFFTKQVDEAST